MPALPFDWGARLRRERERRKWSRKWLAEQIGAGASSVYRWEEEGDSPRPEMLQALVTLLGKPVSAWGRSLRMMPHLRNRYFTGREHILNRLHMDLGRREVVAGNANQSQSAIRAISGMGGIGKTQTAIEYVYRYGEEYDLALWALADSRATLIEQFAGFAADLGVAHQAETDALRLANAVKRWLETQRELVWLLVFDNVEDMQVAQEFLPGHGLGAVLITTRLRDVGPHIHTLALEPMTREEGLRFFQARLGREEDAGWEREERESAEQIWTLLGGLPLALDQAAAFAQGTGTRLAEYCALWRQAQGALLRRRGPYPAGHADSVAVTFEMAWKQVDQRSPAAGALLRLSAFLAPAAIPEELFLAGMAAAPPALRAVMKQPLGWQETVGVLRRYSLLEREGATQSLSVHRLVQAVLRDELDQETQRRWAEQVVRMVNAAFPEVTPETWPQCERLAPQAMRATEWIEQYQASDGVEEMDEAAVRLLFVTGQYLHYRGRYAEAESRYQLTLRARERRWGAAHPRVAEALIKLGALAREQGKFAEAEALCQRALAIVERQEGDDRYGQIAEALNILAIAASSRGQYAESVRFHLRALAICEQWLGVSHHDTARSLNNLANVYQFFGRYLEAESLYTRALGIWELQLGPENTRLAYPLMGLGAAYHNLGRYAEAEARFLRALRIWEEPAGLDRPEMAYPLTGLGNLYAEQKRNTESEWLYRRALRIWDERLGPDHPESAGTRSGLASLYAQQGRHAAARDLYQQTLRIWERQMGVEHLFTIETVRALAELDSAHDAGEDARDRYVSALAMRERALNALFASDTTAACRHLVAMLRAMAHFQEAARVRATCERREEGV